MEDKAFLEAISKMMDEKLDKQLTPVRQDIADMKENLQEVREAQNYLIDWVDNLAKAVKAK